MCISMSSISGPPSEDIWESEKWRIEGKNNDKSTGTVKATVMVKARVRVMAKAKVTVEAESIVGFRECSAMFVQCSYYCIKGQLG
jgi:hypothetical protein